MLAVSKATLGGKHEVGQEESVQVAGVPRGAARASPMEATCFEKAGGAWNVCPSLGSP